MKDIDWTEIAPKIIGDVADDLLSDRKAVERDDNRTAYGTRGSFVVDKRRGQFFDFEEHVGGGLFDMVKHLTGMETNDVFKWLTEQGFLDGSYEPKVKSRPKITKPPVDDNKYLDYGKRLWREAVAIPFDPEHPVRKWAHHRNLLPDLLAFPRCIRYHQGNQYIVTAMSDLDSWLSPQPKAKSFQLISIDNNGNKRLQFDDGTNDKRVFGKQSGNGIIILGYPHLKVVHLCEGLADGISVYARMEGAVIIAVTTIAKLAKEDIIKILVDREVIVWADNDDAGQTAASKTMNAIHKAGGHVSYIEPQCGFKDPADAARLNPFPDIDKHEFQRRVIQFKNRTEPEREAFILCHKIVREEK